MTINKELYSKIAGAYSNSDTLSPSFRLEQDSHFTSVLKVCGCEDEERFYRSTDRLKKNEVMKVSGCLDFSGQFDNKLCFARMSDGSLFSIFENDSALFFKTPPKKRGPKPRSLSPEEEAVKVRKRLDYINEKQKERTKGRVDTIERLKSEVVYLKGIIESMTKTS